MYMRDGQHVHMPKITLTELRKDLFRLADKALETGEPVVIERNGRTMVLMEAGKPFEPAPAMTYAERVEAFFAKPSPFPPFDYDPDDNSHWTWSPDDALDPPQ
jgi:hypothetical protein